MIAHQGNPWWIGLGLSSLFLLSQILFSALRDHRAGMPVDVHAVAGLSLSFLAFAGFPAFQVLTH
jgi:hypothetical protein